MEVVRMNLMGVRQHELPWGELIKLGAPNTSLESPLRRMTLPCIPREERQRGDFTMVRFVQGATRSTIAQFARADGVRLATPRECLAVGRACPWLASELGVRSFALLSPRVCRISTNELDNEEWDHCSDARDAERCLVGIRYVVVPDAPRNYRIAHPYWFEDAYPNGYWFLFADRTTAQKPRMPADEPSRQAVS